MTNNPSLLILTTATPRLDIFKAGLFPAIKFLREHFNVNWVVNLDQPPMCSEEDFKEAEAGILEFFYDYSIRGHFTVNVKNPSFAAAGRNVFLTAEKLGYYDYYMWLEDDWIITDPKKYSKDIEIYKQSNKDFLLSVRNYVCGNPYIFRADFFKAVVKAFNKAMVDPELMFFAVRAFQRNGMNKKSPELNSIQSDVFADLGRNWREDKKIQKRDKYDKNQSETWIQT